jgi:protein-tyrosine phosphatase
VTPRPYYLLAGPGGDIRVAERLLPLKGGRNFRDLGGYRSADGRQVRWGRLYRSGVMVGLTAEDMAYLRGLGIRTICDLRSPEERTAAPTPFLKEAGVEVLSTDYKMPSAINAIAQARTREQAARTFAAAYVGFTETLAPQYAQMFAKLVRGEAPLAVNCSAGKDRTGMASALILSALAVPREAVLADYALTEVYSPSSYFLQQAKDGDGWRKLGLPAEQAKIFAELPPEVLKVMMGSDAAVLRQALAMIDAKYGGPIQLAKARFGLTDAGVATLRRTYLI